MPYLSLNCNKSFILYLLERYVKFRPDNFGFGVIFLLALQRFGVIVGYAGNHVLSHRYFTADGPALETCQEISIAINSMHRIGSSALVVVSCSQAPGTGF